MGRAHLVLIGLISDTHGLLRPDVHRAFTGVELILHAGDVGGDAILEELARIAPVKAVWGNTDPPGDARLRECLDLVLEGLSVHVSHGHELGRPKPAQLAGAYDADVIIYGHTHRQLVSRVREQLIVNPGAAGPCRFDLAPSVGLLRIGDGIASAELIEVLA